MTFPLFEEDNAPEGSKEWLAKAKQNFGMIPNVEKVMALSPQLLASYTFMWDEFNTTTLSPIERQVVYMTANFENECNYCVPWHTILSEQAGIDAQDIEALRNGTTLNDKKLQALSHYTRLLIANRGKVTAPQLTEFFAAGYTNVQALEVLVGLATKLISNFTNSIAGTPLDEEASSKVWAKPFV